MLLTEKQKDLLLAWASELENGGRLQTRGYLCSYEGTPDDLTTADYGGDDEWGGLREPNPDEIGYCCLGVLCDIAPMAEWDVQWRGDSYDYTMSKLNGEYCGGYTTSNAVPPTELLAEYGLLRTDNPQFDTEREGDLFLQTGFVDYLAFLNDNGSTFKEIASLIRKYVANGGPKEGAIA